MEKLHHKSYTTVSIAAGKNVSLRASFSSYSRRPEQSRIEPQPDGLNQADTKQAKDDMPTTYTATLKAVAPINVRSMGTI